MKPYDSPQLHSEFLAEYQSLREEILKRIEIRQQVLTFTLVVAGAILSYGTAKPDDGVILLLYPLLALFLAIAWMQSDVRAGEIGNYIKDQIETKLDGIRWETYIRQKKIDEKKSILKKANAISASGVFVTTSLVAMLIGISKIDFAAFAVSKYYIEIVLVIVDAVAVIYMFKIIGRRRSKHKNR